ncbi:MAG: hypothetical protein V2I63_10025, partial [Pseudomonadales bacterium]|jgi:Cu/Ag efflux pump CusA|nr:hypothetical protein [Pseudomonadales bacterium]
MFEPSTLSVYIAPIAVTLCFGLAFATLLVLLVIPALILLVEAAHERSGTAFGRLLTRVVRSREDGIAHPGDP